MQLIPAAIDKLNACAFPPIAIDPKSPGNRTAVIKNPASPYDKGTECSRLIDSRAVTIPAARATISGQRDGLLLFAWRTRLSADSSVSSDIFVIPNVVKIFDAGVSWATRQLQLRQNLWLDKADTPTRTP